MLPQSGESRLWEEGYNEKKVFTTLAGFIRYTGMNSQQQQGVHNTNNNSTAGNVQQRTLNCYVCGKLDTMHQIAG